MKSEMLLRLLVFMIFGLFFQFDLAFSELDINPIFKVQVQENSAPSIQHKTVDFESRSTKKSIEIRQIPGYETIYYETDDAREETQNSTSEETPDYYTDEENAEESPDFDYKEKKPTERIIDYETAEIPEKAERKEAQGTAEESMDYPIETTTEPDFDYDHKEKGKKAKEGTSENPEQGAGAESTTTEMITKATTTAQVAQTTEKSAKAPEETLEKPLETTEPPIETTEKTTKITENITEKSQKTTAKPEKTTEKFEEPEKATEKTAQTTEKSEQTTDKTTKKSQETTKKFEEPEKTTEKSDEAEKTTTNKDHFTATDTSSPLPTVLPTILTTAPSLTSIPLPSTTTTTKLTTTTTESTTIKTTTTFTTDSTGGAETQVLSETETTPVENESTFQRTMPSNPLKAVGWVLTHIFGSFWLDDGA